MIHLIHLECVNKSVISVDLKKAFKSVRRDFIRQVIIKRAPGMLRIFSGLYGHHSAPLAINGSEVTSSGVRQGNTLSSVRFSLGYSRILVEFRDRLHLNGFQDDVTCVSC